MIRIAYPFNAEMLVASDASKMRKCANRPDYTEQRTETNH